MYAPPSAIAKGTAKAAVGRDFRLEEVRDTPHETAQGLSIPAFGPV
jgi:hypothetical protein